MSDLMMASTDGRGLSRSQKAAAVLLAELRIRKNIIAKLKDKES